MELALLVKVGMIMEGIIRAGYLLAGSYVLRTGVKYIKDYKHSIEKEKIEVE